MSVILALDTSTDACSVALMHAGQIDEDFRIIPRQHTQQLLPMVKAMLQKHQLRVQDLDAIAFGRGPGSFAGIRIATGVAQGLAFGAELPMLPVSTLEAMALSAHQAGAEHVIAALDARMDEVYWAAYHFAQGLPVQVAPERVDAPVSLSCPDTALQWQGVGSGWCYQASMPASVQEAVVSIQQDIYPTAAAIATLALRDFQAGKTVAPEQALPVYLRDDVAWKKKDQQ